MTSNVGLKGLRGTLESALESDDISPLIKLVSSSGTARQTPEADDAAVSPSSSPALKSKKTDDGGLAIAEGTLNGVIQTLQGISDRRDLELKRTCQANSSEISSALKELSAVQATSADLRRRAQETSASMQRMGAHFSGRMDALDEALLVRDRIQQTRSALATAMHIISLSKEVAESIENGQLYHSRKLLIRLKTRYGPALKASAAAGEHGDHGLAAFQIEGHPATQRASLAGTLLARINELDSKVDLRLTSCLNEWLTQARAGAGTVGRKAMELMEAEKKHKIVLAEQRRQMLILQKEEEGNGLVDQTADALKTKLSLSSSIGSSSITNNNCASDTSTKGDDNFDDTILKSDPASIVDMTLLLRCVHVHSSENTLSQLLESYVEARQAQLGADLAPPGDLLICHRAFLWQIVGFFVLETRVGLVAPQLETSSHTEASWEGASAALAAELGAAIDEASRPEHIRELKKQALLACDAIDRYCGDALSTRGIRSTLTSRVAKVRTTMAIGVAAALEEAAAATTREGDNTPNIITSSSSSSAINKSEIEALVTRLSKECSEYMSGLVEEHELPAATCIEVDHILAAAISTKVAGFLIKDGQEDTNLDDAYLTTDSDDEGSWDSEEEEEEEEEESEGSSEDEGSEGSVSRSGSLYSDRDEDGGMGSESSSGGSDSQSTEEDDDEDTQSTIDDEEEDTEDEDEELFIKLLEVVSTAAAAENALNNLRRQLLGPFTTSSTTFSSPPPVDSFVNSPTTQLSGALMATEDVAGRRIANSAYTAVDALADLDWSPQSIPRAAGGSNISSQFAEIVEVLEAGREALEACGVPVVSQQRILVSAVKKIEEEIMRLFVSEAVPYINVFGAQKLLSDLQVLSTFATASSSTAATSTSSATSKSKEWASEPTLFGEIIAFNKASELLDARKRGEKYASVNLDRFVLLLEKVKDPTGPPSAGGRGLVKSEEEARRVGLELKNILLAERGGASRSF